MTTTYNIFFFLSTIALRTSAATVRLLAEHIGIVDVSSRHRSNATAHPTTIHLATLQKN